jgi:tol-pal system protein YbgF
MSQLPRTWIAMLAGSVLLVGCETTPPGPDPMQVKLNDIDERLGRVERVVSNQSLVSLSQRMDVLEAQLRELRGSVEEMQNGNESLRKQQRDLYADLDRRLKALEGSLRGGGVAPESTGAVAPTPGPAGRSPVVGADDQAAYNRAFDALKSSDYAGAIAQFKEFLRQYPNSALADNAQYWLGEGYYVTRSYDDAIAAFRTVNQQYPQSRKAADALLKLGYSQYELKHMADARATLSQVVQKYPGTDAAKLAAERLTKIPPDAP